MVTAETYIVPQLKYNKPWVAVESRKDLGKGGSTRVMMFVRGVGMRLGIMTVAFEKPWKVIDPDWFGEERDLELNEVACYLSLEDFPWPNDAKEQPRN
jgi:hypothetical protein